MGTGVTLQHAREVFWRHRHLIPRQKMECVFTLLIQTFGWDCENTSEWQGVNSRFISPSHSPSHLQDTQTWLPGAGRHARWQREHLPGAPAAAGLQTLSLERSPEANTAHPALLSTSFSFYISAVRGVSLLFLPTLSHTLEVNSGSDNVMLMPSLPGQTCPVIFKAISYVLYVLHAFSGMLKIQFLEVSIAVGSGNSTTYA